MVQNYEVFSNYTGDNTKLDYTFDFYITDKQDLRVVILDGDGAIVSDVRGDDTSIIDSVDIESRPFRNGGTLNLKANLATDYELWILLDPLEPIQDARFRDQADWSLGDIERVFDYLLTAIQRLFFIGRKAVRVPDYLSNYDSPSFNPVLPDDVIGAVNKVLMTNDDGDGWEMGPTATDISNAQSNATAAAASATAASASATAAAASAVAAAASAAEAATSVGTLQLTIVGTRTAPTNVTAAGGIAFTSTTERTVNFVQGSGGSVIVTAAARIQAGTSVGQTLKLIGRSDVNYVDLQDGNGIVTGGMTIRLGENSIAQFIWDGTNWVLDYTNGLIA